MNWNHHVEVGLKRGRVVSRRDVLKGITLAGMAGTVGFSDWMSLQAAELRKQGKACILLWMQGGPSQFETFSPKPDHKNGGETKAIATNVSGIEIAENLPQVAKVMDKLAVLRSVTNKEGNHIRASYQLHTGYVPTATVKHPTLGSIVANEIEHPECDLPSFVRIGRTRGDAGGGLLGVEFDPFELASAERPPDNTTVLTSEGRHTRRLGLLKRLEKGFAEQGGREAVEDHRKLYDKASRMVLSSQMKAFDLSAEPSKVREAYGRGSFASGCLLARRLIETGVTFVEVAMNGWDTHNENFQRCKQLCGGLDRPFAQLITDLDQRGMLDDTLVIWMGEFGRTPRINGRTGRDHYPRAFNAAVAGAGIQGGQVVGETDAGGYSVKERPITVADLFRSYCQALGIDADKENMSPIGRPIRVVDGGQPIRELFG